MADTNELVRKCQIAIEAFRGLHPNSEITLAELRLGFDDGAMTINVMPTPEPAVPWAEES